MNRIKRLFRKIDAIASLFFSGVDFAVPRILLCIGIGLISYGIYYNTNIFLFKVFVIVATTLVILSVINIVYTHYASTFIKFGFLKKMLIIGFFLAVLTIAYMIGLYFNESWLVCKIDFIFEKIKNDFFTAIITGLIVTYITGVSMQKFTSEQHNNEKLKEIKIILQSAGQADDVIEKVIGMLERLVEDLHLESIYFLGTVYHDSQYGKKEFHEAEKLFKRAAERGHKEAIIALGELYYDGQDYNEALKWYRRVAAQGNPKAQYNIGLMHYYGQGGFMQSYENARNFFNRAAEQGHAGAQYYLGVIYHEGLGVIGDDDKAIRYYKDALKNECEKAESKLEEMRSKGLFVNQDAGEEKIILDNINPEEDVI